MKNFWTYFFIIVAFLAMVFGMVKCLSNKGDNKAFNKKANIVIDSYRQQVDTLKKQYNVIDSKAKTYSDSVKTAKAEEKTISNNYKPVYEKISNTVDTNQLHITYELLAKHRTNSFERN